MTRFIVALLGMLLTSDIVSYALHVNEGNPHTFTIIGNIAMPIMAAFIVIVVSDGWKLTKEALDDSEN